MTKEQELRARAERAEAEVERLRVAPGGSLLVRAEKAEAERDQAQAQVMVEGHARLAAEAEVDRLRKILGDWQAAATAHRQIRDVYTTASDPESPE